MAEGSVRADRHAMTAGYTEWFMAWHQFRIAFFVFEADNGSGAVSDTESVLLAFVFIDIQ
jgi:hypothetical protein